MQNLLRRSLIALAICLGAVLVCYFWIDRPKAFFVDRHHLDQVKVFHWLTYPRRNSRLVKPVEFKSVTEDFSGQ